MTLYHHRVIYHSLMRSFNGKAEARRLHFLEPFIPSPTIRQMIFFGFISDDNANRIRMKCESDPLMGIINIKGH